MRHFFRSPNAGQTSLSLQHSTSPRSGYRPNLGANRDGYPTGGIPIRTGFKRGGPVSKRTSPKKDKVIQGIKHGIKKFGKESIWIPKAVDTTKKLVGSIRDTTRNPHKDSLFTKPRREKPKASDLWRKGDKVRDPQIQKKLDLINRLAPRRKHLKPTVAPRPNYKKGGWIQDVNKSIKKRGTKGKCTPITKKGCTGRAKALAKTFKKMAKKRKS